LTGTYHYLNYLQHNQTIVEFAMISSAKQILVPAHISNVSSWYLRSLLNITAATTASSHNQRMSIISFPSKFKDISSLLTLVAGILESFILNITLQHHTATMPNSTTTNEPRPFNVGGVWGGMAAASIAIIIGIILFVRHKRRRMLRRGMYSNQVQGIPLQRWYGH
jgi:hypothetical protein